MVVTRFSRAIASVLLVVGGVFACSSSSSSSSGASSGSSGTTGADGGGDEAAAPTDAGAEAAAPKPVNGCTVGKNFSDHTAASDARTIEWDFSIAQSPSRCMTIKAGQTVTWQSPGGGAADLTTYPLEPSGGDTPNPITNIDAQTGRVTFPKKGIFGYDSSNAPAMTGAVEVQ